MLRLMCITAHPDDEAGAFGGALRLYAERGVETFVLCLTAGQAATNRGATQSDQELMAARRLEFVESCKILKVGRGLVLDYPDGKLHLQEITRVVEELTFHVREFRPHVLLTFGTEGGLTGHTDHAMATLFATLAFHWAGREDKFPEQLRAAPGPHRTQKLYQATADFSLPGRPPLSLAPATAILDIGDLLDEKIRAFRCHASQGPLLDMFEDIARQHGKREMFHLAAATNYQPLQHETDLFTGVVEN